MGYGESGMARTGLAPHISARDNIPTRAMGGPGEPGIFRALSVQPWDVQPVPTAINFFKQQTANLVLAGAAGSTVVTTLAGNGALQAAANNIVSLQSVGIFCDAPTVLTSISYIVRANGVPFPGLDPVKFPPQAAAFFNFFVPGPFNVVLAGAFIDVLITRVVADVANLVNSTLIGWQCSPQDVQRWTGVVPGQV